MAKKPPITQRDTINNGSPKSLAIRPVVVKIPPQIILLTSRQLAVYQPIFSVGMRWCADTSKAFLLSPDSPTIFTYA